jgi:hypothetical protein
MLWPAAPKRRAVAGPRPGAGTDESNGRHGESFTAKVHGQVQGRAARYPALAVRREVRA